MHGTICGPLCAACKVELELKGNWSVDDYEYILYQCPKCKTIELKQDNKRRNSIF